METLSVMLPTVASSLPPDPSSSPLHSSSQAFLSSPRWSRCLLSSHALRQKTLLRSSSPAPRCHDANNSDSSNEKCSSLSNFVDRRQLLLASTLGISGLQLLHPHQALGNPVQPPDFKQCTTPIDPGNGAASVDCCLPVSTTISDYKVPNLPMRVRKPAHLAGSDYIAKYEKAYKLLRELPADDPRQYTLQANVHCAFCDAAYDEKGTSIEYQVHNSWLFFPWHRWYLYFHERILGSLIKDDSFALPFWNWDSQAGYTMPAFYLKSKSSLYDLNRNSSHMPPAVVDLNYNFTDSGLSSSAQLTANNTVMYRQLVTNSKTPSLFFGQAYRQGDEASPGAGTVENTPHGVVHIWTGNPSNPNDEDMGALYSAARDPMFFAHHSNVDRLWTVWKNLGGRRRDFTDTDWLDATFLFYDENAKLVRVKVRDALDTTKLFYKYQDVPNNWLKAAPTSSATSTATAMHLGTTPATAMAAGLQDKLKERVKERLKDMKEFRQRASKKVENVVTALVKRPKKVKASDEEEEILVLKGVEIPSDERVKFDVFINLPDSEGKEGSDISNYAGSFFNVPHSAMKMEGSKRIRKSNFRIGIGDVLNELGIEDDDAFSITIVPKSKTSIPIKIEDVDLEYE